MDKLSVIQYYKYISRPKINLENQTEIYIVINY